MPPRAQINRPEKAKSTDNATHVILYDGATVSQLSVLFRMDRRKITERLHSVPPSGMVRGNHVWLIHEVAPHLVRPVFDIEQYIRRMNHADLPPLLTKEFWNGMRARHAALLEAGELWETGDVVEMVAELFKVVRMSMLLLPDAMDKTVGISREQRAVVRGKVDSSLREARETIREYFKEDGKFGRHREELDERFDSNEEI